MNQCPITPEVEQAMEDVSGTASEEHFRHHWEAGTYACARCQTPLYASTSKWEGPCKWPSFRGEIAEGALHAIPVTEYNGYTCPMAEIYCGGCKLFLGCVGRGQGAEATNLPWFCLS